MPQICLCGSTRFMDKFHEANVALTKLGASVITISMALPKNQEGVEEDKALKVILDLVHLDKICRSDAIYVVSNDTGYFGFSTAREILWADMKEKIILPWSYDYETAMMVIKSGGANHGHHRLLVNEAREKLGL